MTKRLETLIEEGRERQARNAELAAKTDSILAGLYASEALRLAAANDLAGACEASTLAAKHGKRAAGGER